MGWDETTFSYLVWSHRGNGMSHLGIFLAYARDSCPSKSRGRGRPRWVDRSLHARGEDERRLRLVALQARDECEAPVQAPAGCGRRSGRAEAGLWRVMASSGPGVARNRPCNPRLQHGLRRAMGGGPSGLRWGSDGRQRVTASGQRAADLASAQATAGNASGRARWAMASSGPWVALDRSPGKEPG